MPLLAAVIVSGGRLRRVYFLSTALAVVDAIVCALGPESLEPSRRKPLKLRTAHPLSFLRLFTHGRKLRRLAIMQFLGNCSEGGHGTDPPEQIANLHRSCVAVAASNALRALTANPACGRRTTLGWSVPHRARWDSLTALIRVAFSQTVPKAVAKLGQMNCWSIGVVVCEHHHFVTDPPRGVPRCPCLLTWCLWEQTSRTPSRWR